MHSPASPSSPLSFPSPSLLSSLPSPLPLSLLAVYSKQADTLWINTTISLPSLSLSLAEKKEDIPKKNKNE
jgi:hypothetical protein